MQMRKETVVEDCAAEDDEWTAYGDSRKCGRADVAGRVQPCTNGFTIGDRIDVKLLKLSVLAATVPLVGAASPGADAAAERISSVHPFAA